MNYKHTQIGYLIIYTFAFVLCTFFFIFNSHGFDKIWIIAFVIAIVILTSLFTLTVKIDDKKLKVKFWYWIYRAKFLLSEIKSVKVVKNPWYYGWGIRFWFWPKIIIYNVSGFDAVELVMKNGSIYRIWTDEPKKLEKAINKEI